MRQATASRLLLAGLLLAGTAARAADAPDGAALFNQHCAACHQPDGAGTIGLAPALKGPHWAALGERREYLPTVLLKGMAGLIKVNGQTIVGSMPAFAATLDDAALAAVANHLATLQGASTRPAYAAADIAPLRAAKGDPAATRALRRSVLGD